MSLRRNRCLKCGWFGGHDLDALVSTCPACGWEFQDSDWKQFPQTKVNELTQTFNPVAPIPPAQFTDEMLEQFRAVVREELDREEKSEDDSSPVAISPVKYYVPEIEGHAPLEAKIEHQGKLYKGTLYFVKDVE